MRLLFDTACRGAGAQFYDSAAGSFMLRSPR